MKSYPWNAGAVGVLQAVTADIDYTVAPANGSGTVDIITLPAGCLVKQVIVEVAQAFNAGGNNILTVGANANTDDLVAAGDVNAGALGYTESPAAQKIRTTEAVTIKAKYAQTNGAGVAATAGKARVTVEFVRLTAE